MPTACPAYPACLTGSNPCALNTQMINMPLFKCLLAALSVLSRVGGMRSWIAPLRDPLLRRWIVPVRNVSVHVA